MSAVLALLLLLSMLADSQNAAARSCYPVLVVLVEASLLPLVLGLGLHSAVQGVAFQNVHHKGHAAEAWVVIVAMTVVMS
jgi:hypothetical protein